MSKMDPLDYKKDTAKLIEQTENVLKQKCAEVKTEYSDSKKHNPLALKLSHLRTRDFTYLLSSFQNVLSENDLKLQADIDHTLELFRIPLFGREKGGPTNDSIGVKELIILGANLHQFRINDQAIHDRLFDLALSMESEVKEKEKFWNFLFYLSAKRHDKANYRRMKDQMYKLNCFDEIQIKQNADQCIRALAFQQDFSDINLWRHLIELRFSNKLTEYQ